MTDTEILVNRFIKLRYQLGVSMKDVSDASKVIAEQTNNSYHFIHDTQVCMMENKRRKPSLDVLARCFRALGYKIAVIPINAKVYYRREDEDEGHRIT